MRSVQKEEPKRVERISRVDWLIHFRLAVTHDTLDHMAERLWNSDLEHTIKLNMWMAYGDRQDEIDHNKFVKRVALPKFT